MPRDLTRGEFKSEDEIFLVKIQEKRKEVAKALERSNDAKEAAKEAKAAWEVEVAELDQLIQDSEKIPLEDFADRQRNNDDE